MLSERNKTSGYFVLCAVNAAILAGLLLYSATLAFIWDEGFHVLAGKLISMGQKPYLDFCFPQTPLNAYVNAALVVLFGNHWQPLHLVAAFFTWCAIFLISDFVYRNLPIAEWRLAGSIFAALSFVSIYHLIEFATVGQAYGICLAFTAASFRCAVHAARRANLTWIFAAGLCAGIAAASSLLVAAAIPVVWIWNIVANRAIARWRTAAAFIAGVAIPFSPVVWLFAIAPRQTIFNVFSYQAIYRRANWGGATQHDLQVMLDLGKSPDALLLVVLALAGLRFVARGDWSKQMRSAIYLAALMAIAIGAEVGTAHPTFERYFILTIPFLAVPAAVGFIGFGSKIAGARGLRILLIAVACVFAVSVAGQIHADREASNWRDMEAVAARVAEVSPPGSAIYADEMIYFLTGFPVPEGMQFFYGHRLALPASEEALYHVISQARLDEMVRARRFATFETCSDDDVARLRLDLLYSQHADIGECSVFWTIR